MTTVVDASVVVDWIAPDLDPTAPALALLARWAQADEPLSAPRLLLHEVGNALVTGVRRRRWTGAEADAAHVHLSALPLALIDNLEDAARAYELARRHDQHPVYDMVYVAVAERIGATLVTADERLLTRLRHVPWVIGVDEALAR